MHELPNVQTDFINEIQDLREELAFLKEKDARNRSQIELLKSKLRSFESAKEALTQSELKYRNLFENSLIAIFRTDAQTGEILYANSMVWEILDTDPRKGVSALNFYANPEDRANYLRDLMENGKVEDIQVFCQINGRIFFNDS